MKELNTGRDKNNFGIENSYRAEDLYAILIKDDKPVSYALKTNWSKIAVPGYDPVIDITASLECELKAKYEINAGKTPTNRFSKVFWFQADLWVPNRVLEVGFWSTKFSGVNEKLKDLGVRLIQPPTRSSYARGQWHTDNVQNKTLYHDFGNGGFFITDEKGSSRIAIGLTARPIINPIPGATSQSYDLGLRVVCPWLYGELGSVADIAKAQNDFLVAVRNTKTAIYRVDKKDSPGILTFRKENELKEEKEKLIERIKCDFCASSYDRSPANLSCPNCGGSN